MDTFAETIRTPQEPAPASPSRASPLPPAPSGRPGGPRPAGETCESVRQDLCRFAVGVAPGQPLAALARHVHRCPGCGRYIDDLARVRAWLERSAQQGPELTASLAELVARARDALARELAARLARDLWDLGHGRPPRDAALRRADVRRLLALWGPGPLREDPWPAAVRLIVRERRPVDRAPALALATRLDPLGLDVSLSHIASLEHRGQRRAAEEEADRLLGLLR